ncbi:MAG: hypothetical protein QW520_01065 [Methanomassiliicoccales archaeon]
MSSGSLNGQRYDDLMRGITGVEEVEGGKKTQRMGLKSHASGEEVQDDGSLFYLFMFLLASQVITVRGGGGKSLGPSFLRKGASAHRTT